MYQRPNPVVLIILDGFGYRKELAYNAIAKAATPNLDTWWKQRPHMLLQASGPAVGLPEGQMGNSEVGHMHIGAGRIIFQKFTEINKAIHNGNFFKNPVFLELINTLKVSKKTLHVMGLLSEGGVHSHENQLYAFLQLCFQEQCKNIVLHLFLDGRDTPPRSALDSLARLEAQLKIYPVASIGSISGRYYAMDRDQRWDRIQTLYTLLTEEQSPTPYKDAKEAVKAFYAKNLNDEFIPPTNIGQAKPIKTGDAVFFFNFRADRARQLTEAFTADSFNHFIRNKRPELSSFVSMTNYDVHLKTVIAFPNDPLLNTLGEVVAKAGLSQLRLAETEKYAHVTFFLNGGSECVFQKEERLLIPSEQVATYDLAPAMRAPEITEALIKAIESNRFDLIICNYANADMIGHTGNFEAVLQSIACLDSCLGAVAAASRKTQGRMLITADHGNAEIMFDETTNQIHTAHTKEPVPLFYIDDDNQWTFNKELGSLTDVAPTILALLGLEKPHIMTGKSLLVKKHA